MAHENFYSTQLKVATTDTATDIEVDTPPAIITEGNLVISATNPALREIIRFTGVTGNTLTGCIRGYDNSTALPHTAGEPVALHAIAADFLASFTPQPGAIGTTELQPGAVTSDIMGVIDFCYVYRDTDQSINNGTWTAVSFNKEDEDVPGWHANGANPERVTVDSAGLYEISVYIDWADTSVNDKQWSVIIAKNSTNPPVDANAVPAHEPKMSETFATGLNERGTLTMKKRLDATDYVSALVFQSTGGNLAVARASIQVTKVGL